VARGFRKSSKHFVEFDDHLTLFEVPLNEARSKAVIDKHGPFGLKSL